MKRKLIIAFIASLGLSACSSTAPSNDIASLYTGYETGSWYKVSNTCSAKLCATY